MLGAKDDHVGEIAARLLKHLVVARVLAEVAARGEDGLDGLYDDSRRWEGEVACIVLFQLVSKREQQVFFDQEVALQSQPHRLA